MKHSMGALLLSLVLVLTGCQALAEGATYVFPYEGFRYTQRENETVLTQTNLDEHLDLIEQLGTTEEAVLSSYIASGIVMEVFPADGGQIAVSVADAGDFDDVMDMIDLDEARRAAFLAQFEESGLYESCAYVETTPLCVRLTSSAMVASMPVYTLRYATLHLGRLYLMEQTIVGRKPEAADDARMEALLSGVKLLTTVSEATPEPTPAPTATPEPTPIPTPGTAEILSTTGEMELNELPAFVMEDELTVSGKTLPSKDVSVYLGKDAEGELLGRAPSRKDGSFSMRVKLPQEGSLELFVTAGEADACAALRYEMPMAKLDITEPEETTFNGRSIMIKGVTEPNATVYISGKVVNTNVQAGKNGNFSVRAFIEEEGSDTFTLRAKADGFKETERKITLTRAYTDRELVGEFRQKIIEVNYDSLSKAPQKYLGKQFILRGKVMDFTDYDGEPCALVCVSNPATGVWHDPIYVVLPADLEVHKEDILTFYLKGEGLTLPAAGAYTQSGTEEEAPVTRAVHASKNK